MINVLLTQAIRLVGLATKNCGVLFAKIEGKMARKKKMSYQSFLRYLRRTRDENIWRLISSGRVRTLVPGSLIYYRGCPITSVCLRLTGTRYDEGNYWDAAEDINLDGRIVDTIVRAADNHAITTRQRQVRRSLLRAVGLQERRA